MIASLLPAMGAALFILLSAVDLHNSSSLATFKPSYSATTTKKNKQELSISEMYEISCILKSDNVRECRIYLAAFAYTYVHV